MTLRSFASDNYAGAHPEILAALTDANRGHMSSYGGDAVTKAAEAVLQQHFGAEARVFFVCNGTAANVLTLAALAKPHEAIVCPDGAHINVDECGAAERFGGNKLLQVPAVDGKITPDALERRLGGRNDVHRVQPRVVSISQATELGTVYTVDEIRALAACAHAHGLLLQVDGARLANAAASLGVSLGAMTREVGVDAVSFGGTKNGLMFGEAVVLLNDSVARDFPFVRKQGMQLLSKMRFVSAQFLALMQGDLWLRSAQHANAMARRLAAGVADLRGMRVTRPVQTNAVFVTLPRAWIAELQRLSYFYMWNEETCEARWMTSFDTTPADVDAFVATVERLAHG
jgi:threonine aldolase